MKVGNLVGGLEVVNVKRVNKLNLIQFLKEVDSYLQQGYKIDVNSSRQVGLVLSVDLYKTEVVCSPKVESVDASPKVGSTEVGSTGVKVESKADESKVEAVQAVDTEIKEVESAVESTPVKVEAGTDTTVKKPTTTRSKKTATQ